MVPINAKGGPVSNPHEVEKCAPQTTPRNSARVVPLQDRVPPYTPKPVGFQSDQTTERKRRSGGWSPERRARQAEAIRRWKPWLKSTGPTSRRGKLASAANFRAHKRRSVKWVNPRLPPWLRPTLA